MTQDPDKGCSGCPKLVDLPIDYPGNGTTGCADQPEDAWPGEPDRRHLKVAHHYTAPEWCPLRSEHRMWCPDCRRETVFRGEPVTTPWCCDSCHRRYIGPITKPKSRLLAEPFNPAREAGAVHLAGEGRSLVGLIEFARRCFEAGQRSRDAEVTRWKQVACDTGEGLVIVRVKLRALAAAARGVLDENQDDYAAFVKLEDALEALGDETT